MSPFVMDWRGRLQCDIVTAFATGHGEVLDAIGRADRLHLAIMREPWATLIADGSKRVESRWGKVGCAPHRRIGAGDVIAWKRTGGPVYGVSFVTMATTDYLGSDQMAAKFLAGCYEAVRLPNDPASVAGKRLLTLAYLGPFVPTPVPIVCKQPGRAGWVVFYDRAALRQAQLDIDCLADEED